LITLGAKFGGPEHDDFAFDHAWMAVANALTLMYGLKYTEWQGKVSGVNVIFHVAGSVVGKSMIPPFGPARFLSKKRLLLVDVPVPDDIIHDFDKSFSFLVDALHKANHVAAEVYTKKGSEPFDLARAETLVNSAAEYRTDTSVHQKVDEYIQHRRKQFQQPSLKGFTSEVGWTLQQRQVDGGPVFLRINTAAKAIQGHPELPCRLSVRIALLHSNAHGLPSREESIQLEAIENEMARVMEPAQDGYFVAATSTNGVRELMFYVRGPKHAELALLAAEKVASGHRLESVVEEDKNWDAYKKLLQG
jgi:hypothetical protein